MANYLHVAQGLLATSFPWSFRLYSSSSASESAAETAWHTAIDAWFNLSAFNVLLPTDVSLTGTYTSTMSAAWKQTTKTQTLTTIVGTASSGSLPYHVSEVVTLRTNQATKYGRGRWYLPPLATAALASGGFYLSSAAVTAIVDGVNAAIASWSGTLNPLLLHREGTRSGPGPLTTDPIVSGDVPDGLDTQRRRADKRVPTRTALTF